MQLSFWLDGRGEEECYSRRRKRSATAAMLQWSHVLSNVETTVLVSVVETREQYAVRRVRWAAELYRREGLMPPEWQLMMRACVYSLRENSAVKCAIDVAMRLLESELLQSYAGEAAS